MGGVTRNDLKRLARRAGEFGRVGLSLPAAAGRAACHTLPQRAGGPHNLPIHTHDWSKFNTQVKEL